jgi:acylphosphatase
MGRQALRDGRTDRKNACMSAAPIRVRLRIHGRVQGVFFRDSVRRTALEHGVSGWAENRSDGSVEAVLEGEPDAVRAVAAFCREGPSHARVDRVEEHAEPAEGLRRFEVR